MKTARAFVAPDHAKRTGSLFTLLLSLGLCLPTFADTFTITKVGQGVYYKKYHYNALFGAQEDVYILDANLNDPEVSVRFPCVLGPAYGQAYVPVSTHVARTPGTVGAVNGQFFDIPGGVGMASTANGDGYWTVAKDGGIFSFNAPFQGSLGGHGIKNILGMVSTPTEGYWLFASDGGVFSFAAPFWGSAGGQGLNDFVGMAARIDAGGYWLVRNNGAIYTYGAMNYRGGANEPGQFAGIAAGPSSFDGYWLLKKDGAIYSFGDAAYQGGANY